MDFGTIGSSETDALNMEAGDDSPSIEDTQGSPLAMWETDIQSIGLEKGSLGLGFSILDYQVCLGFLCYIKELWLLLEFLSIFKQ